MEVRKATLNAVAEHARRLDYSLMKLEELSGKVEEHTEQLTASNNTIKSIIHYLIKHDRIDHDQAQRILTEANKISKSIKNVRGVVYNGTKTSKNTIQGHQDKLLEHLGNIKGYDSSKAEDKARREVKSQKSTYIDPPKEINEDNNSFQRADSLA